MTIKEISSGMCQSSGGNEWSYILELLALQPGDHVLSNTVQTNLECGRGHVEDIGSHFEYSQNFFQERFIFHVWKGIIVFLEPVSCHG